MSALLIELAQWSLNLSQRETLSWPEIHQEPTVAQNWDEFAPR